MTDQEELEVWKKQAKSYHDTAVALEGDLANEKAWHDATKDLLRGERLKHRQTKGKLRTANDSEEIHPRAPVAVETENKSHQDGYALGRDHEHESVLRNIRNTVEHGTERKWPMKALDWFWNAYAPDDKDGYDKDHPAL